MKNFLNIILVVFYLLPLTINAKEIVEEPVDSIEMIEEQPPVEQIFEPASLPALIQALRIDEPMYYCGEKVPLHVQEVKERFEKELLLTLWDRAQVVLWIKRSRRYLPIIEKALQKHKLPDDLKYVAVIESALLPHIGSSKGAMGYWQFMKSTGRRFGLTIDNKIDQRRNIFASTEAACRYFDKLHSLLGSWILASAAYNMGEDRLQRAIKSQEVNDFYQLYLPMETQRYIFKILSAKLILMDPARFGFNVNESDLYPPLEFDQVTFECPVITPLQIVANAAESYYKKIKDLNPELRGQDLGKGIHTLAIPKDTGEAFYASFDILLEEWRQENAVKTYIVRKGDNLSLIAERFDVPLRSLLRWNRLNPKYHIYPGKELVIYQ